MKFTLLLNILLCISGAIQGQNSTDEEIILTEACEGRDIKQKDFEDGIKTRPRSIIFQSVYAYLSNKTIDINFVKDFASVSVTITKEAIGEVTYAETYATPIMCNIDLSNASTGFYLIRIEADDICLEGSFSL